MIKRLFLALKARWHAPTPLFYKRIYRLWSGFMAVCVIVAASADDLKGLENILPERFKGYGDTVLGICLLMGFINSIIAKLQMKKEVVEPQVNENIGGTN